MKKIIGYRNNPSPKDPIAETSYRRNVLSPKSPIAESVVAETSRRRTVPSPNRKSPKRLVTKTASPNGCRRMGVAETASPNCPRPPFRMYRNPPSSNSMQAMSKEMNSIGFVGVIGAQAELSAAFDLFYTVDKLCTQPPDFSHFHTCLASRTLSSDGRTYFPHQNVT